MNPFVVSAKNLGKCYRIADHRHDFMLRDVLARSCAAPFRRFFAHATDARLTSPSVDRRANHLNQIWALKNVSFEIKTGEVVGIVGRNGAGKSTLLKILSRITEPTEGEARIYGRAGSLLEVGTGFHSELTGRENVYLSGAILGMKKAEIDRKFDEIVAFAEVEKFIDTPVKHYSSGMYMRLAFAVAAHLEPEMLIVDEVLAVGDAAFQKKCLSKMEGTAREGRTVLFVSHDMVAIERLCPRVIMLSDGEVRYDGKSKEAIERYLGSFSINGKRWKRTTGEFNLRDAPRGGKFAEASDRVFQTLYIRDCEGRPRDIITCGEDVVFAIQYETQEAIQNPAVGIIFSCEAHGRLAFLQTEIQHSDILSLPKSGELICTIPRLPLAAGCYTVSLGFSSGGRQIDWIEDQVDFHVEPGDFFGTGRLPPPTHGPLLLKAGWTLSSGSNNE